jgi:serine/threonine protein kinase
LPRNSNLSTSLKSLELLALSSNHQPTNITAIAATFRLPSSKHHHSCQSPYKQLPSFSRGGSPSNLVNMPQQDVFIGASGIVRLHRQESIATKIAFDPDDQHIILAEAEIYKRLGSNQGIVRFIEVRGKHLVLELLQCSLASRLDALSKEGQRPSRKQVLQWAKQITLAFKHIHSRDVKQVDIHPRNVLLDFDDNAKLVDFAGSSLDDSEPLAFPSPRFTKQSVAVPSIQAEIFAIGSLFYQLETTRPPYHEEESESKVSKLFDSDIFPETSSLLLRNVIDRCWNLRYSQASDILLDLDGLGLELNDQASMYSIVGSLFQQTWNMIVYCVSGVLKRWPSLFELYKSQ